MTNVIMFFWDFIIPSFLFVILVFQVAINLVDKNHKPKKNVVKNINPDNTSLSHQRVFQLPLSNFSKMSLVFYFKVYEYKMFNFFICIQVYDDLKNEKSKKYTYH